MPCRRSATGVVAIDWCRRKLWGHHPYYGITGNGEALSSFKHAVEQHETPSRVYSGVVKE